MFVIQFIQVLRIYPFSGTGNRIASFNKKHYLCRVPPFILWGYRAPATRYLA